MRAFLESFKCGDPFAQKLDIAETIEKGADYNNAGKMTHMEFN